MIRVTVTGAAETAAALQRAASELGGVAARAVREGAEIVADQLRTVAPVESGMMRRSTHVVDGAGESAIAVVDARRVSRSYPGGYPYPRKVDERTGFVSRAAAAAAPRVNDLMDRRVQEALGGAS